MDLPDRNDPAEEAFVRYWSDQADTDGLLLQIEAAMDARRPMLAARLVNLLDEWVDITPGSALDRARQAARFVIANRPSPEDRSWSALEEAWRDARKKRLKQIRERHRHRMTGEAPKRRGRIQRRKR